MAKAKSEWRRKWREAKEKHKNHLKTVKFNQDLGPLLDKLYELDSKPLPGGMGAAMSTDTKIKDIAKECSKVANDYLIKINAVADNTAKTELRKVLTDIKADCDNLSR